MVNYMYVAVFLAFMTMSAPYFSKLDPKEYSVHLPHKFDGALRLNERLDQTEKLHENNIHWPETVAIHEGNIYTGLGDGRIVRLTEKEVVDICRIGKECQGQHEEDICGRPLGIRFSESGLLYVADAYHGLFAVNVKTGEKTHLIKSSKVVDGHPLYFLNSLSIDEEEQAVYISQSSTRWNISKVIVSILEHDSSGRLLKYDIKTKTVTVLKNDLSFPNGVVLSHDKKSVLVAEGNKHMISRYHIRGTQKGQFEKIPLVLPGEPDNLSYSKRGHYWIAIANARTAETPTIYDRLSAYPLVRKGFLIMYHFIVFPISAVLKLVPVKALNELSLEILDGRSLADILPAPAAIIEFDENGNVIQSLHSPRGQISHIADVQEHDGYLYLGSWRNHFLGRVKI